MAQDRIDAALYCKTVKKNNKNVSSPIIEPLNSEMPRKNMQKEKGRRMLKTLLNRLRLRRCASVTISKPDPTYRVAYLGNVVTGWAKGDGCVEKPLTTLWRNYTQSSRPDVRMQLTVSGGGLKATTKDHGLTEYWAHRLTTCAAPVHFPRLFCWVYRHEGRRLRHELRCHAVLCPSVTIAKQIETELKHSLSLALAEFKRDKISRQNARLSLVNSVYENPTIPRRKILLSTGSQNYRPPLERSKSAPKLSSIEEIIDEEEDLCEELCKRNVYKNILKNYECTTTALLDRRKHYNNKYYQINKPTVPASSSIKICGKILKDEKSLNNHNNNNNNKVQFNDDVLELSLDDKSDMILDELVQNSFRNDLLESCERAWFNALNETPDLIPLDSDEGSLSSSGCESATSTVTSDIDQQLLSIPIDEEKSNDELFQEEQQMEKSKPDLKKKTDVDFKVGCSVLARVRSFERINSDIFKYCGLTSSSLYNNNNNKNLLGNEEVSLIPVGESPTDFSSLRVYKKKNVLFEPARDVCLFKGGDDDLCGDDGAGSEGENESACSDESGYEEEDVASSIANMVLV